MFVHLLNDRRTWGRGAVPPPSPLWTPANLGATLKAWYQGDILAGSNGAAISSWSDSSGNGNAATASSGTEPTLVTSLQNSLNGVRFVNGKAFSLPNFYSGKSAASAYMVLKRLADPSASFQVSALWSVGNTGADTHFPDPSGDVYDSFGTTGRKSCGNPVPSLAAWRIYGVYSALNDWADYIDGVLFFSTATNTVGFTATPALGKSPNSFYMDGWIAEAIFTDSKQSSTDRQKIEGYLAWKWGLTGNLDASHPYKSSAP